MLTARKEEFVAAVLLILAVLDFTTAQQPFNVACSGFAHRWLASSVSGTSRTVPDSGVDPINSVHLHHAACN